MTWRLRQADTHRWSDQEAQSALQYRLSPNLFLSERLYLEEVWIRNISYYFGRQHFYQEGTTIKPVLDVPPHRVLYKANFFKQAVLRAAAKLQGVSGSVQTAPDNNTRQAQKVSEVSDRVLEHLIEATDYSERKFEATIWAALCGMGVMKAWWDPTAGKPDRFYLDQEGRVYEPQSEEEKNKLDDAGQYTDMPNGEIKVDVISPFSFKWDWGIRTGKFDDCRWLAQDGTITVEQAADRFDIEPDDLRANADDTVGAPYYEELLSFMSSSVLHRSRTSGISRTREGLARYIEYWERPAKNNGWKGRLVIQVGDTIVRNGPNPYADIEGIKYPFVKVAWQFAPGRMVPLSLGEDLSAPQHQYNRARGTATEFQNVYGHPSLFVPKGSGIPTGILTVEPGAVYEFNPLWGAPVPGPTPTLSREVMENASVCRGEMQALSADSDPDSSKLPAQIRSGAGLRMMMEEKDKVLAPSAKASLSADRAMGSLMLGLARKYYRDDRVVKYVGQSKRIEVLAFKGSDLVNDVRMIGEPGEIRSRGVERAEIMDMLQIDPTIIQDPVIRPRILEAMNLPDADRFMDDLLLDRDNQKREIDEILMDPQGWAMKLQPNQQTGEVLGGYPINEWDDHGAHLAEIELFIKSQDYRNSDPISQDVLLAHWRSHRAMVRQQLQAMQQAQQASSGSQTAQRGTASQPARQ